MSIALQDLDRRGLARPIRAEDREHLAGLHAEAQPIDNRAPAVSLDQIAYDDRSRIARRRQRISHNARARMFASLVEWVPLLNAALIVISGICLIVGYVFIKTGRIT